MILLDTSALIELFKGNEKGRKINDRLRNDEAAITPITIHEFMVLANDKEQKVFEDFLNTAIILSYDESSAFESADIERKLMKKGSIISRPDIFIAGIAKSNNICIISLDTDFKRIDGLNAEIF